MFASLPSAARPARPPRPAARGVARLPWRRAGAGGLAFALVLWGNALAYRHAGYRPWGHAVGAACANVTHMLLVGTAAWGTARRTPAPPVGRRWRTVVLRHATIALVAACAVVALGAAAMRLSHHGDPRAAAHPPLDVWASGSWFVFWYAAVAAAVYVLAAQTRLREQERAATQAQIVALRAQINPHFLFNTLHSVAGLAREDAGAVEDVLERLGTLLRYVLRGANLPATGGTVGGDGAGALDFVTVADELAFVRDYLAIEQLRLGARLRVCETVDTAVLDRRLPPLLLQPLVENAVRHGAAPRRAGATLSIRGWRDGACCVLEVGDDGPGADLARSVRPVHPGGVHPGGVGLAAVRGQLAAHYGPRAALRIDTAAGAGFRARITFPAWPHTATREAASADGHA